jgi:large conductance mechanosensitive channel
MARRRRASGFLRDFQEFALKGNVVELAIAVIIGGAFGQIITSLIEDIITPAILQPVMSAAKIDDLANLSYNGIKYGSFLAAVLNFIVISFILFLVIRAIAKFKREEEVAEEASPTDPALLAQERLTGALDRLTQTIQAQGR